eukprot:3333612-Pleurochrysis_carterae.AAC.1
MSATRLVMRARKGRRCRCNDRGVRRRHFIGWCDVRSAMGVLVGGIGLQDGAGIIAEDVRGITSVASR